MRDQKKSVQIACFLSKEDAQAVVRAVKIYMVGVALVAEETPADWAVYVTWNEETEAKAHRFKSDKDYMEQFVLGVALREITMALANAVLQLEAEQ
jgi:hypothetical protein